MTSQQQLDDRRTGEPSQAHSDELHVRELMYARLYVCGTQRTDATLCVEIPFLSFKGTFSCLVVGQTRRGNPDCNRRHLNKVTLILIQL